MTTAKQDITQLEYKGLVNIAKEHSLVGSENTI